MIKIKKFILATSLSVVSMATFAASEVSVWFHAGQGGERETMAAQAEAFNASQSKYEVNIVQLPEGTYTDQVNAAALAGDLPDLLDFDGPNIANYVWSGYLQPVDKLISKKVQADLLPSIIAQGTYPIDNRLYSVGVFDSGLALWGNKKLLEKAGVTIPTKLSDAWTLTQFEEALSKLASTEGVDYPLDMKLNYGEGEWFTYGFSPIIQAAGGDLIDRSKWVAKGTLNSTASVAALTNLQNWNSNDWIVPASAGDNKFYGDKTVGLALVGHWMWGAHSEALGDDLVLIPMPKFGSKHVTGMGSWNWGITKDAKNPKGAAAFIEYLLQKEEVLRMTDANGAVPATKSALAASDKFGADGQLNMYVQQLQAIAVNRPFHPGYPTVTSAFAKAVANILEGNDVKKELDIAARKIDEDIEDNAGYPPFSQ